MPSSSLKKVFNKGKPSKRIKSEQDARLTEVSNLLQLTKKTPNIIAQIINIYNSIQVRNINICENRAKYYQIGDYIKCMMPSYCDIEVKIEKKVCDRKTAASKTAIIERARLDAVERFAAKKKAMIDGGAGHEVADS